MAVSNYTNGHLTVRTRATAKSWQGWASTGAIIVGRTTYDLSIPYWGADGPTGAARVPTVVVSHSVPQDIPDGGVYSFVNGVEAALEKAKKAAGDKDVSHMRAQTLRSNSSNSVSLTKSRFTSSPCCSAAARDCSEHLDSEHIPLETVEVIETAEAIHLRFRVVK